jgi:hypothetical protein
VGRRAILPVPQIINRMGEKEMTRVEQIILGLAMLGVATPAFAADVAPAPVAGVGIGAVLLVGAGYRALKRRIKP